MGIFVYLLLSLSVVNVATAVDVPDYAKSDKFILSLLSDSMGKSNSAYKVLSRIQNGALDLLSSLRGSLTTAKKEKFLRQLKVAVDARNIEKVYDLLGKILLTMQSTESSKELENISSIYAPLLESSSRNARLSGTHPFDPIYNELYVLGGGGTLLFAIDTTGSMAPDIDVAIAIATDIVNDTRRVGEVDYILSPFNDPATGPVITRTYSERGQFITDLGNLDATGGGDCAELAFKGMENALNSSPRPQSSMFVFTDAAPKDGGEFDVQNIIDIAVYWYEVKISFFLDENTCGSESEIAKFKRVAEETGGEIFTLEPLNKKRKRRSITRSKYSSYVSSSLSGTSLVTSGISKSTVTTVPASTRVPEAVYLPSLRIIPFSSRKTVFERKSVVNTHPFDIDEEISYVFIVVTFDVKSTKISLVDSKGKTKSATSTTPNAVIYEVADPITGTWRLKVNGESGTYTYKVSVAFKEPIAFDVRYLLEERPGKYIVVKQPLIGQTQKSLINFVGGDKIDASSIKASFVDLAGNHISTLPITNIGSDGNLKFSASYTPPGKTFRVKLTGKTKKGLNFERRTEQATTPAKLSFTTVFAGDELSAQIGGPTIRIMTVLFIKKGLTKTIKVKASVTVGEIKHAEQSKRVRTRGFFFFQYTPPKGEKKILKGKSAYVTVQASYDSEEVATHRIPILLMP